MRNADAPLGCAPQPAGSDSRRRESPAAARGAAGNSPLGRGLARVLIL